MTENVMVAATTTIRAVASMTSMRPNPFLFFKGEGESAKKRFKKFELFL
jgi:hypothetical protein